MTSAEKTFELFVRDLGYLVRERCLAARESAASARGGPEESYAEGQLFSWVEIASLMQSQALAFQIPLEKLSLDNLDPEQLLVPIKPRDARA